MMKTIAVAVLALIGGFFAGIVLSEVIGTIGFFVFDSTVGFRFVPLVSAGAAAAAAVVAVNHRTRRPAPPAAGHLDAPRHPTDA